MTVALREHLPSKFSLCACWKRWRHDTHDDHGAGVKHFKIIRCRKANFIQKSTLSRAFLNVEPDSIPTAHPLDFSLKAAHPNSSICIMKILNKLQFAAVLLIATASQYKSANIDFLSYQETAEKMPTQNSDINLGQ